MRLALLLNLLLLPVWLHLLRWPLPFLRLPWRRRLCPMRLTLLNLRLLPMLLHLLRPLQPLLLLDLPFALRRRLS